MIQWMWLAMMAGSILYAFLDGNAGMILGKALEGTGEAITLTLKLGAGYLLFCGLMELVRALSFSRWLRWVLRPILRRLMPAVQEAQEAVGLNLSMNMLGLGNAATPMGLEAVRQMEQERERNPAVKHDLYMLLILNATSLQLLPTTVLTLRTAAGSAEANAIILPTLLCTAVSTFTGAGLGLLCRRWEGRHD